ncbi:ABC transporter substrate-binding protein [uncultured Roseovarius sp.]|uniref:ABC transporter substrate-binding protein n=1 Tax=uncultured Roseovarius sp. TaxID=293344 RepID=UPI002617FA7A|nr:ABC transporter substrate-binding protein [uncultured Roseovarius sp.]
MKSTCCALALCALALPATAADLGKTEEPIKLALTEQTGSRITAHVAAEMLKAAGYTVEFVAADELSVFRQMDRGNIDANLEVWPANAAPSFNDLVNERKIIELGELGVAPVEGLAYPAHMETTCPGLPALDALRDCAASFATDGGMPLLTDYPVEWEGPGADLVSALALPFDAAPATSEQALVDTLVEASIEGTPALAMFWQPHWVVAAHDLRFVDLPTAEAACYEDAGWGPNPEAIGDCGFPALTSVKSVVHGFKTRWPAAYFLLEDFQISNETQAALMVAVERDGRPVADVAAEWAAENEDRWRPLIERVIN